MGFEGACKYIENLYGYKTYEMLCDLIYEVYPDAEIISKEKSLKIIAKQDGMARCRRPNIEILREISNFSRHVLEIQTVYMDFENVASNPENKNIIVRICHTVRMYYHQWQYVEKRRNGDIYNPKSQYLMF